MTQEIQSDHLKGGDLSAGDEYGAGISNGAAFAAEQTRRQESLTPEHDDGSSKVVEDVVQSDIGVSTLLNRLKQSIASARDFANFLKKRSGIEEEQAQSLKKLCRSAHEGIRRPDNRQYSYAQQFDEMMRIHERMADNGIQFALSLHQMSEDLVEMTTGVERGRKHWKQTGLNAEKRVQEAQSAMEKAKARYDSLAEDYDRARTGDRQAGKKFGLKGPKSAAQHEEDLQRKVQAADSDYASKVQSAQSQRQELLSALRPQAVQALRDLIHECDSASTLQLQKFASFNERLLLNNGLCVTPLTPAPGDSAPRSQSLRDVVQQIDNEKDLKNYIIGFSSKAPPRTSDIKYERHRTLGPQQQVPPAQAKPQHPSFSNVQQRPPSFSMQVPPQSEGSMPPNFNQAPPPSVQQHRGETDYKGQPPPLAMPNQSVPSTTFSGPPQLPPSQFGQVPQQQPPTPNNDGVPTGELPPLRPVFGVSLDSLFKRDESAVPLVVYQCIQAIDLYGLVVEGIYRLSGTSSHISRIKAVFDNDASKVDFRNPEHFFHDVNSVAGVLKQFFRDLPDPLLTSEHYAELIEASRVDDDIVRRDSLHAIINGLPDPNYATLRALILHLYRVQEHSHINRMNAGNLAICLGPTLMGSNTGPNIADAGWQVRVIDTILQNTYQIFDDD
ncbi:MAG: hypothetical protein M1833_007009 [Piccolia ochrophora]|nr:MAG: hypothetical protein M1833_007009 [Piccolia ochrophora]